MAKGKRETANELSDEKVAKIRSDIARWRAGLFATEVDQQPACQCGLSEHYITGNRGYSRYGVPSLVCHRHGEEQA